jgi:hypothetical protein
MKITERSSVQHIVRKDKKIFLIYEEIQKGSGAKSYVYEEAVIHIEYDFAPDPF